MVEEGVLGEVEGEAEAGDLVAVLVLLALQLLALDVGQVLQDVLILLGQLHSMAV